MARTHRLIALSLAAALVAIAAVAVAVSLVVGSQIRNDALENAQKQAVLLARTAFGRALADEPSGRRRAAEFNHIAADAKRSLGLIQVTVYDSRGAILYDFDQRLIGREVPLTGRLLEAVGGRASSSIVEGGDFVTERTTAKRLESFVPVSGDGDLLGVVHIDLPYGPIAADVSHRLRRLNLILLGAGLLLYLVALPGLVRVARRLDPERERRRRKVAKEIRAALGNGDELKLEYQPITDIATGEVRTVEALVRWDHPGRGRIPPDHFLPWIQDGPVFRDFTMHVLDLAIEQTARWHRNGRDLAVAVNVSVGDVLDTRLPGKIDELCARHGVPCRLIELEVTEQAVMDQVDSAVEVLGHLRRLGVGVIAIDDFGTGYSSLARVRDLPIQALKIDRAFVAEMEARDDPTLVRSIIAMAHNLGLRVIAEGIETEDTWARLRALGCDAGQGYLISRPQPAAVLDAWLHAHEPARLAGISEPTGPERRAGAGRRVEDIFAIGFEKLPDAVGVFDDNGRYVYANAAAGALYERRADELVGATFASLARPENRERAERLWRGIRREGRVRFRVAVLGAKGGVTEVESRIEADVVAGRHIAIMREVVPAADIVLDGR
jgi:PAS domain S-box-containing protein